MLRNRVVTALQKTYDDCYLSCSTAVFYESQGNEAEAMRYWKSAFERISQHHTRQFASTERSPNDEVEMALRKSLKELELQSRERIDLLETLKVSRQHDFGSPGKTESPESTNFAADRPSGSKYIGQGTVPAMRYSDLSRPFCSARQSFSPRRTSENVITNVDGPSTDIAVGTRSPSPLNALKLGKIPRPPSPERHSMRTTLRSGRIIDRSDKNTPLSPRLNGEGPSKAATLAWNTFELRDAVRQPSLQNTSSSATLAAHQHTEPLLNIGPSSAQWDSHSRRLVSPSQTRSPSKLMKTPIASQRLSEYSSPQSSSAASNARGTSSNSELMNLEKGLSDQSSASYTVLTYSASPRPRREDLTATSWTSTTSRLSEKHNSSSPSFPEAKIGHPNPFPFPGHHVDRQGQSRFEEFSDLRPLPTSEASITVDDEDTAKGYIKNNLGITRTDANEGTKRNASPRGNLSEASWARIKMQLLKNLPPGVDESAAQQILNDIVVQGDEVHWGDIAGLEIAKSALREAVVYPFLRPDLFMGLREPARGMLLFGPPGTGKTMLARAVATESRSSFFSISASSLTSKYLGESEKLVKALFSLARALSPSIIFVDEIDSLLSQRSGSGENEATRRIKTEFLIQWSDLQRAAAGKEMTDKDRQRGDANRVLVLAATNMPWAIDEAARRRFVRRQYIPLPEPATREIQLKTLLGQQKHNLTGADIDRLVQLTDGFSGSDMTALAKDAAMGPLRSLGDAVLHMTTDDIRPMEFADFEASLGTIRASVSKVGLERYEEWAKEFGERGG